MNCLYKITSCSSVNIGVACAVILTAAACVSQTSDDAATTSGDAVEAVSSTGASRAKYCGDLAFPVTNRSLPVVNVTDPVYSAIRATGKEKDQYIVAFDTKNVETKTQPACRFTDPGISIGAATEYFALVDQSPNTPMLGHDTSDAVSVSPFRLTLSSPNFPDMTLPSDIEAICLLPSPEKEGAETNAGVSRMLALESYSFHSTNAPGNFDRIFLIDVDVAMGAAKIVHAVKLGAKLATHRTQGKIDMEGMLCSVETSADAEAIESIAVTLFDRGEGNANSSVARPAELIHFDFPFQNDRFCGRSDIPSDCGTFAYARQFRGPLPLSAGHLALTVDDSLRYVSDVLKLSNGDVLAGAAFETDAAPKTFGGLVWVLCDRTDCPTVLSSGTGVTDLTGNNSVLTILPSGEPQKTEGLSEWNELTTVNKGSIVAASDNETMGKVFSVRKP